MKLTKPKIDFKRSGKGRPAKVGPPKMASGVRFVLFIGDEGTVLVHIKDAAVQNRQFVPDGSEQSLQELTSTLAADPKAPLLMVIDTMDQTYVQQTLPPVNALSVGKLIKRRLDRDFGSNDIKGAIILGREQTGRKDWNFLMVGVEKTPQLSVWLDFAAGLPNRLQGVYLVSVETEVVVANLQQAMGPPAEGKRSRWTFFVSHNKVGGFRQVILKDGRLLFTRMTQPIGESLPEVIAGNIEQEMLSTIEYMRRLSFDPHDGLDIYIIASNNIKSVIDGEKFKADAFHVLTPYEVAGYFGIAGATQPTDQFGDVILAAAIGSSRRHVLALPIPQFALFDRIYRLFMMQRAVAAALLLGIFLYAAMLVFDTYQNYMKSDDLEKTGASRQQELDNLRKEIAASNIDVEKSSDITELYQQLMSERLTPLAFFSRLGTVMGPPAEIQSIDWSVDDAAGAKPDTPAPAGKPGNPKITAVILLEFSGKGDMDALRRDAKKLLNDVKNAFPGYEVGYTRLPPGFSEEEKLNVTFTDNDAAASGTPANQPMNIQMTIKGDAIPSPVVAGSQ